MVRFSDAELVKFKQEFDDHARDEKAWKDEINAKLDTLLQERAQVEGGIKLLKILATVVAMGAAAWAWIVAHVPFLKG